MEPVEMLIAIAALATLGIVAAYRGHDSRDGRTTFPHEHRTGETAP